MLKTIKLYGVLGKKFGKVFKLDVSSTKEAVRALCVQVPGFEHFMMNAHHQGMEFAIFLDGKDLGIAKRGKKKSSFYDPDTKRTINGNNIGIEQVEMHTESKVIHIVPRIIGAGGGGVFQTILGVVLVVVGAVAMAYGQAWGASLVGTGIGMIVGGVAQMLMPKIDNENQNQDGNRANKGFGGAVTTVAQGNPVPVLYGQREIGGFIVSAGQFPEDQM
ncbi:tail assembly protein [Acinetobacter sp. A47]|uniref:tail assembly protein n=1 Tax=Acinetobacter sp. A47 TaxID=1561217 RepID=UPI00056E6C4F|nr:tail assembly protein [Acinetobacter sp. A47]